MENSATVANVDWSFLATVEQTAARLQDAEPQPGVPEVNEPSIGRLWSTTERNDLDEFAQQLDACEKLTDLEKIKILGQKLLASGETEGEKINFLVQWMADESGNFKEEAQQIQCLAQWLDFRHFKEAEKIQILARYYWPETFSLDCEALDKLLVPVAVTTTEKSWRSCIGPPMKQPKESPGTCAIAAGIAWMEALHRFQHLKSVGEGKEFPYTLMYDKAFKDLFKECSGDDGYDDEESRFLQEKKTTEWGGLFDEEAIWKPDTGAYVGYVLDKIRHMGGVPATTNRPDPSVPSFLKLDLLSWREYSFLELSPELIAKLMEVHGICLLTLWAFPWYHHFNAGRDDSQVYRSCGRNVDFWLRDKELYPEPQLTLHAVICFAYRFCVDEDNEQQMHVLVQDNHDDATGPERWVHVDEIHALYTGDAPRMSYSASG